MEKNLLFFLFLVIAYAAKEFVINVKNRLITVINAVLKNFCGKFVITQHPRSSADAAFWVMPVCYSCQTDP